jgi:hypothetical protein
MLTKTSARERIAIPARICKAHYWPANSRIKWIAEGIRMILIPLADDAITALHGAYKRLLSTGGLPNERPQDRLCEFGICSCQC